MLCIDICRYPAVSLYSKSYFAGLQYRCGFRNQIFTQVTQYIKEAEHARSTIVVINCESYRKFADNGSDGKTYQGIILQRYNKSTIDTCKHQVLADLTNLNDKMLKVG